MRILRFAEIRESYKLTLNAQESAYIDLILRAARGSGHPLSTESVLLSATLIGLRVVCADVTQRMAVGAVETPLDVSCVNVACNGQDNPEAKRDRAADDASS
jgi:hypothetical protein